MNNSNNKEIIIERALDLFYKKGYEAVGVQEIVDMSGITKPTLYHYFKSKYGLLETILSEGCEPFCAKLENVVNENHQDVPKALMELAKTYIDFCVSNMKLFNLIISLQYSPVQSESHKAVIQHVTRIFASVRGLFELGENSLGNMNGRQVQFALGFLGIINQYLLLICEKNVEGEKIIVSDNEIFMLVHQFMYGIYS